MEKGAGANDVEEWPTKVLTTPWGYSKQNKLVGRYVIDPKNRVFQNLTPDMKKIKQLEIRDDDVMLVTYPKSGTHWTSEILKMLTAGKAEYDKFAKGKEMIEFQNFDDLKKLKSPRVLNSHIHVDDLPVGILDKKCKTVIVNRNPKDVCVSFYNHLVGMGQFDGTWEDFVYLFINNPFFHDWFQYTKDAHEFARRHEFVHTMFFEDLKLNPLNEIEKMAKFLDVSVDNEVISNIAEKCSFLNLKEITNQKMKAVSAQFPNFNLFRKGVIGDWKNWFTVSQNEMFDSVYEERMNGSGITFTFAT